MSALRPSNLGLFGVPFSNACARGKKKKDFEPIARCGAVPIARTSTRRPPGGGTYEGAYDNTAGTVAMMLYARAFADLTFECDTFLALWSSEEEGLRGSNAFANNNCDYCSTACFSNRQFSVTRKLKQGR